MTPDELLSWRLAGQRIIADDSSDPAEVVAHLGAVQAQDYGQSLWALGLRTRATAMAIETAIEHAEILRTWPMRGTIHFIPARDARWMLELLAGRRMRQASSVYRQIGLTEDVLGRAGDIVGGALSMSGRLQRKDLYAILGERGVDCSASPRGSRGGHILGYLSMTGLICLGPLEGKQQTFVLLQDFAPAQHTPIDPAAELAVRYFTSHGPATARDFGWWSGLSLAEARQAASRAGSALVAEESGRGEIYWRGAGQPPGGRLSGAFLLPALDEYTVAYSDRSVLTEGKPIAGGELLNPVMVLDGRVVGLWKATKSRGAVHIALAPFEPGGAADKFTAAAERYAQFQGLPADISLASVSDVRRMWAS